MCPPHPFLFLTSDIATDVLCVCVRACACVRFCKVLFCLAHICIEIVMSSLPFFSLYKYLRCVGFEVFTAVVKKSSVFWDIILYSLLLVNQHFGG
jgi:hypothetical protein